MGLCGGVGGYRAQPPTSTLWDLLQTPWSASQSPGLSGQPLSHQDLAASPSVTSMMGASLGGRQPVENTSLLKPQGKQEVKINLDENLDES